MTAVDTRTGGIAVLGGSDIERADPVRAAAMVTAWLVESRDWLDKAMKSTDPTPIAEHKAWAATVVEAVKQKRLGQEIELDATEMTLRAVRGIGVSIRRGQEAGEIGRLGGDQKRIVDTTIRPSPYDFASHSELYGDGKQGGNGAYVLAQCTDDLFDEAIAQARVEGNLSRANVARKVKANQPPAAEPPIVSDEISTRRTKTAAHDPERLARIRELVDRGMTSRQIADRLDMKHEYVRLLCRQTGIEIVADTVLGSTRKRIDSNRIVEQTVLSLEGTQTALRLIRFEELDPAQAEYWVNSLTHSISALKGLVKQIRKLTQ